MDDEFFSFEIDAQQVRRFADAAWDDDPRYQPGSPHWDGTVPPTFLGAASTLAGRKHSVPQMGFDIGRAFHGTELIHMHADVTVGCRFQVREVFRQLQSVRGARGGTMRRAARLCTFVDENGRVVADTERVILETEQALSVSQPPVAGMQVFDAGLQGRLDPVPVAGVTPQQLNADSGLPTATFASVTRADFVRYALASGDMTAIHFDEYAARAAGYPAPFAMGMLSAAFIGHALTAWTAPTAPWSLNLRFRDLVWPGDSLEVSASPARAGNGGLPTVNLVCQVGDRVVTTATFQDKRIVRAT